MKLELKRSDTVELTALGAAEIAGMQSGLWDESKFDSLHSLRTFAPRPDAIRRYETQFETWSSLLERSSS